MLHLEERAAELIYIILLQITNIVFTCDWHHHGLEKITMTFFYVMMMIMKVSEIELPKKKVSADLLQCSVLHNIHYNSYFLLNNVRKCLNVLCNNICIHVFKQ